MDGCVCVNLSVGMGTATFERAVCLMCVIIKP